MGIVATGGDAMFGLPAATALLVFGFPILWIAYTIGFLIVSRDWENDATPEDDAT